MEILIWSWLQVLIFTARVYGSAPHMIYISYTFPALNFPIKLVFGENYVSYIFPRMEGRRIFVYLKDFWEVVYNRTEILAYSFMACSGHYFESFIESVSSYISYYHRHIFIKTGHLKFAKLPLHKLKVNSRK